MYVIVPCLALLLIIFWEPPQRREQPNTRLCSLDVAHPSRNNFRPLLGTISDTRTHTAASALLASCLLKPTHRGQVTAAINRWHGRRRPRSEKASRRRAHSRVGRWQRTRTTDVAPTCACPCSKGLGFLGIVIIRLYAPTRRPRPCFVPPQARSPGACHRGHQRMARPPPALERKGNPQKGSFPCWALATHQNYSRTTVRACVLACVPGAGSTIER